MIAIVKNKAIFSSRVFSINLVTYPTNHSVMNHIDPVQQGRYYKLNFVLVKPKSGGVFKCAKCITAKNGFVFNGCNHTASYEFIFPIVSLS